MIAADQDAGSVHGDEGRREDGHRPQVFDDIRQQLFRGAQQTRQRLDEEQRKHHQQRSADHHGRHAHRKRLIGALFMSCAALDRDDRRRPDPEQQADARIQRVHRHHDIHRGQTKRARPDRNKIDICQTVQRIGYHGDHCRQQIAQIQPANRRFAHAQPVHSFSPFIIR